MQDRFYWATLLADLRQALLEVEKTTETDLNLKTGIWVEKLVPTAVAAAAPDPNAPAAQAAGPKKRRKTKQPGAEAPPPLNTLLLTFRSVNITQASGKADANSKIA